MKYYLAAWRYNIRDWQTIENTVEWEFSNTLHSTLEAAKDEVAREFEPIRIEWREYNGGAKHVAKAMIQPLRSVAFIAFMIAELIEGEGE